MTLINSLQKIKINSASGYQRLSAFVTVCQGVYNVCGPADFRCVIRAIGLLENLCGWVLLSGVMEHKE